jgi:hypothetical protein
MSFKVGNQVCFTHNFFKKKILKKLDDEKIDKECRIIYEISGTHYDEKYGFFYTLNNCKVTGEKKIKEKYLILASSKSNNIEIQMEQQKVTQYNVDKIVIEKDILLKVLRKQLNIIANVTFYKKMRFFSCIPITNDDEIIKTGETIFYAFK